ncbi:MAG: hypothetical protein ACK4IT_10970 [Thioalkalivibrionaceae bacterium]
MADQKFVVDRGNGLLRCTLGLVWLLLGLGAEASADGRIAGAEVDGLPMWSSSSDVTPPVSGKH